MTNPGGTAAIAEHGAPRFEPLEAKLRPPQLLAGNVPRAALVDLLRDADRADRPCCGRRLATARRPCSRSGPHGHGDGPPGCRLTSATTIRSSCSATSPPRLTASPPLNPPLFEVLASANASIEGTVVPRIGQALAAVETPFVLVLDDLHALTNPQCLDAIDALIDYVPSGSTMVLSGRAQPSRRVGALRARGLVTGDRARASCGWGKRKPANSWTRPSGGFGHRALRTR